MGSYDDIIHLEHPRSKKHAPMSLSDRAAQFAPFAALNGHEELMDETARLTDGKIELDESRKEEINRQLVMLQEKMKGRTLAGPYRIVYFEADPYKAGGVYKTVSGKVKKLDLYKESILLENGECISIENLWEIEEMLLQED